MCELLPPRAKILSLYTINFNFREVTILNVVSLIYKTDIIKIVSRKNRTGRILKSKKNAGTSYLCEQAIIITILYIFTYIIPS